MMKGWTFRGLGIVLLIDCIDYGLEGSGDGSLVLRLRLDTVVEV